MNNLRKFNWITQYNNAKESEELVKPSVSLVIDKAVVIYDEDKPTPPKFMATYNDGRTYKLECDENTTLTTGDTRPSGYNYREMKNAVIGDCVDTIGSGAFQDCNILTSIDIPNGVTSIGSGAFENCSGLASIVIPNSVTSIDYFAFGFCGSLTSCTIGSGVTSISTSLFEECRNLTTVTIPNSVISIGRDAFYQCRSLKSVIIPSNVTNIQFRAFYQCVSLTSVTVEAITPPTINQDYGGIFNGSTCPIFVPDVEAYKSASGWSDYASRLKPISEKP